MPREETTPEEMLETTQYMANAFGIDEAVTYAGGNAAAFTAFAAAFALIMQDMENGKIDCACNVCNVLRNAAKSVAFPRD
jgi:hypothetical protein